MTWDERWALLVRWAPQLWDGTLLTLQIVAIAVIVGLVFAIPLGLARASRHWYVRALPYTYIFFFRGTPLLLQLFLVYYGLSQFEAVRESIFWPYLRDPYWCALITMTLHTAAYIAEILRGAIQSVPSGCPSASHCSTSSCRARFASVCPPTAMK